MQKSWITLPGGERIFVQFQGSKNENSDPWVICLNGLFSDTSLWLGMARHLPKSIKLVSFDFPGQGQSSPLNAPCGPGHLTEFARALTVQMGIERAFLVGLSNGSNVALEWLLRHPSGICGALLCSSMTHVDFAMRLRIEHWLECLEVGGSLMQFDAAAPFLWGDAFLEKRHGLIRAHHRTLIEQGGKAFERLQAATRGAKAHMQGLLHWDIRPHLHKIQAPVHVMTGERDLLTPPWKGRAVSESIAGASFELVPGMGHAYPVEDAEGFAGRLSDIFARLNL